MKPDDVGYRSWPSESWSFVRVETEEGVLCARASRWKGRQVCVKFRSGKWPDTENLWVDVDQCTREPGRLPEYDALRTGYDAQDVLE